MVAVVCSALSVVVVLGLDNAVRRLARAVRSPSVGDGSELLGTLTEREREILKLFAEGLDLPGVGEIRNNSALTVLNAVSGVQRVGLQDQAADGDLGGARRPGGRRFSLILSLPRTGRNKSYRPYRTAGGCPADLARRQWPCPIPIRPS